MRVFTLLLLSVIFATNAEACESKKLYAFGEELKGEKGLTKSIAIICHTNFAYRVRPNLSDEDPEPGPFYCGEKKDSHRIKNLAGRGIQIISSDVDDCVNQNEKSIESLKKDVEALKQILAELNKQ